MVFIVIRFVVVVVVACSPCLANLCCFRFFRARLRLSFQPEPFFISVSGDAARVFGLSATLDLRQPPLYPPKLSLLYVFICFFGHGAGIYLSRMLV